VSWDWETERDKITTQMRRDADLLIGPLELADQMDLDASVSMAIGWLSRVVYGRGTGELIGFLGTGDVQSDHQPQG
jgi:hypothetical protein